jgi:hypothetical protein
MLITGALLQPQRGRNFSNWKPGYREMKNRQGVNWQLKCDQLEFN